MSETKQSNGTAIGLRQRQLRQMLWPQYNENDLWLRTIRNGFTTIPRTMPLIFQVMDRLSKGKPVSSTYFDIWCRAFDECFVVLNKHQEMAFGAGFSGQRAEQTWQNRVGILSELGFVGIKPGPSGPLSYAIVLNPYKVIEKQFAKHKAVITEELYNGLLARAIEIGADDLTEQSIVQQPRKIGAKAK